MSGNGPSDSGNGFGGGGTPSLDCKNVSIKTTIVSPDPGILSTLSVGNILTLTLQTATGPLIAMTNNGNTLGAVFTTNPTLLINCINDGNFYEAEILKITGGNCEVLITAS